MCPNQELKGWPLALQSNTEPTEAHPSGWEPFLLQIQLGHSCLIYSSGSYHSSDKEKTLIVTDKVLKDWASAHLWVSVYPRCLCASYIDLGCFFLKSKSLTVGPMTFVLKITSVYVIHADSWPLHANKWIKIFAGEGGDEADSYHLYEGPALDTYLLPFSRTTEMPFLLFKGLLPSPVTSSCLYILRLWPMNFSSRNTFQRLCSIHSDHYLLLDLRTITLDRLKV